MTAWAGVPGVFGGAAAQVHISLAKSEKSTKYQKITIATGRLFG
jgi:hypothetical protein